MENRVLIDERLETDRLILRARQFDDNCFVFEATRYEGFNDGMPWDPPETIKEMEERYYLTLTNWIKGEAYSFVIVEKENGYRIGIISIRKTDIESKWDIGYWTHPEKQRNGFMKEAASRVLEFGFSRLGANTIQAKYAIWNTGSEKVLLSIGMKKMEYLENGFEKNGAWVKENRMEIAKSEWKKANN
jgi:ribosomal-protein-alanine N-acetyltransferase